MDLGRRRAVAALVAGALLLTGGYLVADVADVVPGPLTAEPPPAPPEPFPTAPAAVEPTGAPDVLSAVDDSAPVPDPLVLSAALTPLVTAPALGGSVSASVADAVTGDVLFSHAADVPVEPASVAKLLTGAAALHRLGPDATTTTRVVQGLAPDEIVLLSGGDVLLAAGPGNPDAVNGHAGLADLAASTAQELLADDRTTVALRLDDTLFAGARTGPGWVPADIQNGYVAPVSGIAVNAGRTTSDNYAPRVSDPAMSAAEQFAQLLAAQGVTVAGSVARAVAPASPQVLAEVTSAPLDGVVAYMLQASDNNVAEALARLVARDVGRPTEFADAAATVLEEMALLGLDTSTAKLADGSGLSDGSLLPASLLTSLLATAASAEHPELRTVVSGLPVAGLNGTLSGRFEAQPAALGLVRGKTGSLKNVTGLAGTVVDADGRLLVYAVLADNVPATVPGRQAADAVAAALAACGCR